MTPKFIHESYQKLENALQRWGNSARGEKAALGYPSTSVIRHFMDSGVSQGGKGPLRFADDLIDVDRLISKLTDDLRRVLYVEFVEGGTVAERVGAFGMSQPTYYRRLEAAKLSLFDLQLKANGYREGVCTELEAEE